MPGGSSVTWEPQGRGSGLGQSLVFETQHGPGSEKGNRVALYTYAVRLKQKVEKRPTSFSKLYGEGAHWGTSEWECFVS